MMAISKYIMNIRKIGFTVILLVAVMFVSSIASAQNSSIHLHFKKSKAKKIDIRFELVHNLIIIPVFINDSDTLKFILDTGVSYTMITNLNGVRGISFNFAREVKLFGLGKGNEIKAFHSFGNLVELPGIIGFNHNVIILEEDFDFLSQGLGTQIHGLIGYDIFESFTVEIDYISKKITLYDPNFYAARKKQKALKKSEIVDIDIIRRKPYINAKVVNEYDEVSDVNLLVDSGASHAVSLFSSADPKLSVPKNSLYAFIGVGLSGEIFGYIGKVNKFILGDFKFKKPIILYPEEESVQMSKIESNRSGSLGSGILKRFTVTFDYKEGELILKPNSNFKDDFKYNLSGIDIFTPFPDVPIYQITKIRQGSPAWIAGLEEGDQIVMINGVETSLYNLSNVIQMLQSKEGKKMTVGIKRENEIFSARFTLDDPIK